MKKLLAGQHNTFTIVQCTESSITVERLEDKIDNMESGTITQSLHVY